VINPAVSALEIQQHACRVPHFYYVPALYLDLYLNFYLNAPFGAGRGAQQNGKVRKTFALMRSAPLRVCLYTRSLDYVRFRVQSWHFRTVTYARWDNLLLVLFLKRVVHAIRQEFVDHEETKGLSGGIGYLLATKGGFYRRNDRDLAFVEIFSRRDTRNNRGDVPFSPSLRFLESASFGNRLGRLVGSSAENTGEKKEGNATVFFAALDI